MSEQRWKRLLPLIFLAFYTLAAWRLVQEDRLSFWLALIATLPVATIWLIVLLKEEVRIWRSLGNRD